MERDELDPLRKYAESAHSYLRPLPAAIDTKISVFAAAMTGALIFTIDVLSKRDTGEPGSFAVMVATLGALILIVAVVLGLSALIARISGNTEDLFSVVAFAARKTPDEVVAGLSARPPNELINMQLRHCHELALITMTKSKRFNIACVAGALGVVLAATGVILM